MSRQTRVSRTKSRTPDIRYWPNWAVYLAMLMIFLAGVATGMLWLTAPWIVFVLIGAALAAVLLLLLRRR
jgi:hypothetical protein